MNRWSQEQADASYLNAFPEVRQWVTHCQLCGRYGAHPDAPYSGFNAGTQRFIARTLEGAMSVNADGLCEQCGNALEQQ